MIIICNFYLWFQALEMQIRELEDRKRAFEQEKHEWESTNGITVDELKRRSLEANSKEWVFFQCVFFFSSFFFIWPLNLWADFILFIICAISLLPSSMLLLLFRFHWHIFCSFIRFHFINLVILRAKLLHFHNNNKKTVQ